MAHARQALGHWTVFPAAFYFHFETWSFVFLCFSGWLWTHSTPQKMLDLQSSCLRYSLGLEQSSLAGIIFLNSEKLHEFSVSYFVLLVIVSFLFLSFLLFSLPPSLLLSLPPFLLEVLGVIESRGSRMWGMHSIAELCPCPSVFNQNSSPIIFIQH